jgi:two-component system sensor kinase FixL
MNEMGAAIAHEINQPLTAAANYQETARILLGRLNETDPEAARDQINEMLALSVEQNKRASQIIARMRRFIENRDVQPIDEAITLGFTSHVASKPVATVEIAKDAQCVTADPIQVQQVLVNLIRNAADAMVDQERRELKIFVLVDPDDSTFNRIEVRDTGIGIPEEAREKLFSAFVTSKADGMGVGLSISQSIIKAMGGRIWATPHPDIGMKFAFTLPRGIKS